MRLRVGYAPSLAAGMLSAAVENFTQAHPNARVELFDLSTEEMLAGLESDKLDVALSVGQQRANAGTEMDAARPRAVAAGGEPQSSARPAVAGDAR